MIKFRCGSCDKKIGVPEQAAGKRVRCPSCKEPTRVPAIEQDIAAFDTDALASSAPSQGGRPDLDALAAMEAGSASEGLQSVDPLPKPSASVSAADRAEDRDIKVCPKCGAQAAASAKICVNCGHGFGGLGAKGRARASKTALFAGRSGIAIGGGLVTALVAGVIWAAVVRYTGYEIGWLAWGLGVGVGFAVAVIARTQNQGVGVAAAAVALLGWTAGKLLILYWALPAITAAEMQEFTEAFGDLMSSEEIVEMQVIEELHEDGEIDEALYETWLIDEQTPEERAQIDRLVADWIAINGDPESIEFDLETEMRNSINELGPINAMIEFEIISWIDALWVLLMLSSAWKIGSVGFEGE
jgi:ribosomal protein L40E